MCYASLCDASAMNENKPVACTLLKVVLNLVHEGWQQQTHLSPGL